MKTIYTGTACSCKPGQQRDNCPQCEGSGKTINFAAMRAPTKTKEETQAEQLQGIGRNAMESIAEMVASLECDYDRLQELRDARDNYEPEDDAPIGGWAEANPDDAIELKELFDAAGECNDHDDALTRIHEDPLSIEYRSGWVNSKNDMQPEEFKILLSTGGPAVQIIGEIDQHMQPTNCKLQAQDWFTPWTDYTDADQDILQTYCSQFCFE